MEYQTESNFGCLFLFSSSLLSLVNDRTALKHNSWTMDAIKKKMQAMKLEKDNAMDRADACEQQAKDANLRAERVRKETIERPNWLQEKSKQIVNMTRIQAA